MSTKNLMSVSVGQTTSVCTLLSDGISHRRLLDLGLTPGASVTCLYSAPSGDPRAYLIRGAVIALRNADAKQVLIGQ